MKRLESKVAIITGGNAGVGSEIAKLFASEGATVVISARRVEPLEEVAKEIREAGGEVLCVPTDISKVDDVKNLVNKTMEAYGKVDVLVNNAGILDKGLNAIDQGIYEIGNFLGEFFIRKCMWSTPATIKSTATSIKKFYKSMLDHKNIEKEDYDVLCCIIKENMDTWQSLCATYNDPDEENPFFFF